MKLLVTVEVNVISNNDRLSHNEIINGFRDYFSSDKDTTSAEHVEFRMKYKSIEIVE